jgi:hypothetical protein
MIGWMYRLDFRERHLLRVWYFNPLLKLHIRSIFRYGNTCLLFLDLAVIGLLEHRLIISCFSIASLYDLDIAQATLSYSEYSAGVISGSHDRLLVKRIALVRG